jgi:uncharacterized membrane protein
LKMRRISASKPYTTLLTWHVGLVIVITLAALAIRLALIERGATLDEMTSFMLFGRINIVRALTNYASPNNHLLHTLLMQGSYRLLGLELWMLRLPALITGVLAIPAAYWAGRALYRPSVGLIAAGLCAVSLPLIDYATQARGYSLYVLLFCVQMALAAQVIRQPRAWRWGAFALVCALGFYTIPLYVFPCGIVCAWLLLLIVIEKRGRVRVRMLTRFVAAVGAGAVLTLLLYAPIWTQANGINQLFNNADIRTLRADIVPGGGGTAIPAFVPILRGMVNYPATGFTLPMLIGMALLLVIGMIGHRRIGQHVLPMWAAALVWLIPSALVTPLFIPERTWIFLIPLYALIIAAGFVISADILRRVRGAAWVMGGAAALALLGLGYSVMTSRTVADLRVGVSPDAEAVALAMGELYTDADRALIPFPHSAPVRYYLLYHDYFEDNVAASDRNIERDFFKTHDGRIFAYLPNIWRRDLFLIEFFRLDIGGLNVRIETLATFESGILAELVVEQTP